MITPVFAFAGQAIFTVEPSAEWCAKTPESQPHYTYRINKVDYPSGTRWFANLLTGPDNTESYTYIGMVSPDSPHVTATQKSKLPVTSIPSRILSRVLAAIVEARGYEIEKAGWKVHHVGKCGKCGAALTVPESIERGLGPTCFKSSKLGVMV